MGSENEGKGMCAAGGCGMCGCGHSHKHLIKVLIKIAIVAAIFCFAFKMGELKGMLESRGGNFGGHGYYGDMMYGSAFDNTGGVQTPVQAQ